MLELDVNNDDVVEDGDPEGDPVGDLDLDDFMDPDPYRIIDVRNTTW